MTRDSGVNYRLLASNAATAFAAQGIIFATSIVMSLVVPKVLGVTAYGYWQLFIFYIGYSGFFHFGLDDGVYLLEGGKERDEINKRSMNSQFMCCLGIQLIVALCVTLIACFSSADQDRAFVLYAFGAYTLLYNSSMFLGFIFQAMNETKLYSFMCMIDRLVFLVPMLVLVCLRVAEFQLFVIAYLFARMCSFVYACWKGRDILAAGLFSARESVRLAVKSAKVGFALMLANVASILILGAARAFIDAKWGIEIFGQVSFSLSMVNFFSQFVNQASMVLFPSLRQGTEAERRSVYRGMRDSLEILFPLVYLLYFPVTWLLVWWLPQYEESMRYFAILLPLCVFDAKMSICGTTYLKVLREEKTLLGINAVAALCSTLLALVGVYLVGSVDVTLMGSVICIVCRSLWTSSHLNKRMGVSSSPLAAEEVLLTAAFLGLALFGSSWLGLPCYAAAYIVYVFLNRGIVAGLLGSIKRVFG